MEEKSLNEKEAEHKAGMMAVTEPQQFLNTIQLYHWLEICNLHDT